MRCFWRGRGLSLRSFSGTIARYSIFAQYREHRGTAGGGVHGGRGGVRITADEVWLFVPCYQREHE